MPLFFVPEYHNTNGPLKITETAFTRVADIFLNGGKELGYKIHDCNGNDGDQEGICDLLKKKFFKIDVFVNTLTLDYMHVLNSMLCSDIFTFPFRFEGFAGFRRLPETGYGQVQLEVF